MSVQTNIEIVKEWHKLHIDNKLPHTEIASIYGVHRGTVRRNFKRFNLESHNYHNMIKHNKNKFSEIKTEEDAYWLGFIYADGYVSDKNDFEVSLMKADYKHLEKLRSYLELSTKVYVDDFRCRLVYRNKILVDNLKRLGVRPRKSLTLAFPTQVPNNLVKDFIRGYFDGDGCLGLYKKQNKTKESVIVYMSVLGTKSFLEGVRKHSPVSFGKYVKNNGSENTLVLSTAHKKARTFAHWLYYDAAIYLDRKYKKFEKIAVLWSDPQDYYWGIKQGTLTT